MASVFYSWNKSYTSCLLQLLRVAMYENPITACAITFLFHVRIYSENYKGNELIRKEESHITKIAHIEASSTIYVYAVSLFVLSCSNYDVIL